MKKTELTKLINTNLKHRLPVYEARFSSGSQDDYILATMLAHLGGFQSLLTVARSRLGINETHMRALHERKRRIISRVSLEYMPYDLSGKSLEVLDEQIKEILSYFNLATNWSVSIRLAILTNILFLPPKHEPILFSKVGAPERYPAIYFTEQVSPSQIKQFVQANTEEVRNATKSLPKPIKPKPELRTMLWGQIVRILLGSMAYGTEDVFSTVHEKLETIYKNQQDVKVPDRGELRKFYERFLQYSNLVGRPQIMFVHFPVEPES